MHYYHILDIQRSGKCVVKIHLKWKSPLFWTTITFMLFIGIRLPKSLLKHPKLSYKLFLDSITNQILIMTPLSFDILNVHSWACLS
jgi:hypothetical protein